MSYVKIYKINDKDKDIFKSKMDELYQLYGTNSLAQKIGVVPSAINHWINGERMPNSENIAKILKEFNLELEDIGAKCREVERTPFDYTIDKLLKENGLKQKDLADAIDVTDSSISKYCSGERIPKVDVIKKIADYFDVSIDYLLTGVSAETDIAINIGFNNDEYKKLEELKVLSDKQKYIGSLFKVESKIPTELDIFKYILLNKDFLKDFRNNISEYLNLENERNRYNNLPGSDRKKVKEKFDNDEGKIRTDLSIEFLKFYDSYLKTIKTTNNKNMKQNKRKNK